MTTIVYLNQNSEKAQQTSDRHRIAATIRASLSYLLPDAEDAGLQATAQAIALALHGLDVDLQFPVDRKI